MTDSEPLDALRLLQEDLKDDDYDQAIASVKRLSTIALALGPARTRNELIPFLATYCDQDNDEAHTAIAQQLGIMSELVGGSAHVTVLLPVLEKLAGEEECVVRDAAVNSLCKLAGTIATPQLATHFVPVIRRLANGDWFTTRVSAAGLFASSYVNCEPAVQEEMRSIFQTLCNDDTPMVRKAAYKHLGPFSTAVQQNYFKTDVLPILTKISQDDVDSMRVHAINACVDLALTLDPKEFGESVLPVVEALQDDASWKVRKSLAENIPQLCENCGEAGEVNAKKLLPIFARLLKDKEAEVRTASAKSLSAVCNLVKGGVQEHIAPLMTALSTDQNQTVRAELAKSIGALFISLGKETAQKVLVPLLQQLAQDEAFEVRNSIVADIDMVTECLGSPSLAQVLLPVLIELSKDQKWRVRMAVIEKASFIAKHLGVQKFEKKMQGIVITCLSDHVYSIRERCCAQIGLIVKEYGGAWASQKFFPQAFQIYDKNTNYLHRMTCLLIITSSASACSADIIEKDLLPLVLTAAIDDVPNVRLAAAKAMAAIIPHLDAALVKAKLVPLLDTLMEDADSDVAFFSRSAKQTVA